MSTHLPSSSLALLSPQEALDPGGPSSLHEGSRLPRPRHCAPLRHRPRRLFPWYWGARLTGVTVALAGCKAHVLVWRGDRRGKHPPLALPVPQTQPYSNRQASPPKLHLCPVAVQLQGHSEAPQQRWPGLAAQSCQQGTHRALPAFRTAFPHSSSVQMSQRGFSVVSLKLTNLWSSSSTDVKERGQGPKGTRAGITDMAGASSCLAGSSR